MKRILIIPVLAILSSASVRAESPTEREFAQTRADREKQVAAAVDPINRCSFFRRAAGIFATWFRR